MGGGDVHQLVENVVLRVLTPGARDSGPAPVLRVLCVVGEDVATFALHEPNALPVWVPAGELTRDLAAGRLRALARDPMVRGVWLTIGVEDSTRDPERPTRAGRGQTTEAGGPSEAESTRYTQWRARAPASDSGVP